MLLRHQFYEDVTVYVISRDAVFARMLELELCEAGVTVVRTEEFPRDEARNGELRIFTASSQVLESDSRRGVHVEFGFSDIGSGCAERYFKRPFAIEDFVNAVFSIVGEGDGSSLVAMEGNAATVSDPYVQVGLTSEEGRFFYNGEMLSLTETEHSLLSLLYERRGETVTREELLTHVWGRTENENDRKTNLTDVYIRYLREKLDDRFGVRIIFSVRGKGYMLK